ncbi:hypothetical protein FACS1894189_3770 [Planctomycetales bacterium]|nr:hypothetical protein FACS1894189_3770 [Planctomycetales bacterium]
MLSLNDRAAQLSELRRLPPSEQAKKHITDATSAEEKTIILQARKKTGISPKVSEQPKTKSNFLNFMRENKGKIALGGLVSLGGGIFAAKFGKAGKWGKKPNIPHDAKSFSMNERIRAFDASFESDRKAYNQGIADLMVKENAAKEELIQKFPSVVQKNGLVERFEKTRTTDEWERWSSEQRKDYWIYYPKLIKIEEAAERQMIKFENDRKEQKIQLLKEMFPSTNPDNRLFADEVMKDLKLDPQDQKEISEVVGGILDHNKVNMKGVKLEVETKIVAFGAAGGSSWLAKDRIGVRLGISDKKDTRAIIHEWGHIIEGITAKNWMAQNGQYKKVSNVHNGLGDRIKDYYVKNCGKENIELSQMNLNVLATGEFYRTLPIKTPTPYSGRRYDSGNTELISTFLEHLFAGPGHLSKEYPDFFNLIMGAMR